MVDKRTGVPISDGDTGTTSRARVDKVDDGKARVYVSSLDTGDDTGASPVNSTDCNLRFRKIKSANGDTLGVDPDDVIGSSFEKIWKRVGKGIVYSWSMSLESPDKWTVQMNVDGKDILDEPDGVLVVDMINPIGYNLKSSNGVAYDAIGLFMVGDTVFWNGPLTFGMKYKTSFEITAKNESGDKKFKFGHVNLTEVP